MPKPRLLFLPAEKFLWLYGQIRGSGSRAAPFCDILRDLSNPTTPDPGVYGMVHLDQRVRTEQMKPSEYTSLDGTALAALVSQGEVTPAEFAATARAAIDTVNPQLNAVIGQFDAVADDAHPQSGLFAGVQFGAWSLILGIPCREP